MILEATSARNRGYCATCYGTHGPLSWLVRFALFLGAIIGISCLIVALPFIAAWCSIQKAIRTRRFPFDRAALLSALRRIHPDGNDGQFYLNGVIDGYWDASPKRRTRRGESAYVYGCGDGDRLRRGEIEVSDIPTHRSPIPPPVFTPGIRHRT